METEDLRTLYFTVISGTNERIMCKNENQPLIIDNKIQADEFAMRRNKMCIGDIDINVEYIVMSVLDFLDKFGYR